MVPGVRGPKLVPLVAEVSARATGDRWLGSSAAAKWEPSARPAEREETTETRRSQPHLADHPSRHRQPERGTQQLHGDEQHDDDARNAAQDRRDRDPGEARLSRRTGRSRGNRSREPGRRGRRLPGRARSRRGGRRGRRWACRVSSRSGRWDRGRRRGSWACRRRDRRSDGRRPGRDDGGGDGRLDRGRDGRRRQHRGGREQRRRWQRDRRRQ